MAADKSEQEIDKTGESTNQRPQDAIAQAVSSLKDTLANESQASRQQERREDKGSKKIEIATLTFVILTTLGIFWQGTILHNSDETFKKTLESQKLSSERQLRAYVFAAPYRAFNIDSRNGVAQVYTTIGNKGATFAHAVERSVGISLLPGPTPEKFEDLGSLKRQEGVLVIAPGGEGFVIQNFRPLTDKELSKIMTHEGDLRLYAFGKITYRDEFQKSHSTVFCYVYFGPERLPFGEGFAYESWQAKYCDRHNEAN